MSVSLIAWGRFFDAEGNKITVPAPSTEPGAPWLWDFLTAQIPTLTHSFDDLQLPPASKAQGGAGAGCDGYGVFDLRDLGAKNQQGSVPTRYGSKASLLKLISVAHANGMRVFLDTVLHQLEGSQAPGVYEYLGADGITKNGRGGPTTQGWFRGSPAPPWCNEDAVPVPFYDFAFGDEKSFQNCRIQVPYQGQQIQATIADALDFGDWLFRTTGADGSRFDDTKGTWANFVAWFMQVNAMAGKPFYSEFFDNPANVNAWATSYPMSGRSGAEDFGNHFAIQSACDGNTAWPLNDGGYSNWRPDLSYVFVDNPDTDTSPGQQVISNKLLGYAYALTIACKQVLVYGKDYYPSSVWPGAYGLRKWIDNLCWINRRLAYGVQSTQHVDNKVIVLQRNGHGGSVGTSPGLLTIINFDPIDARTVTVPTCFWPGTQLHDFTGHCPDTTCDSAGNATLTVPSNYFGNGQSYGCFSWSGVDSGPIVLTSHPTTQVIFGAVDLDIGPAPINAPLQCGSVYCREGSEITLALSAQAGETVTVTVTDPASTVIFDAVLQVDKAASAKVHVSGLHTVSILSNTGAPIPFELAITYMAPKS